MTASIIDRELQSGAEHTIYDMKFRRRFSVNPYKTLRMKLGEMSFWKDWLMGVPRSMRQRRRWRRSAVLRRSHWDRRCWE